MYNNNFCVGCDYKIYRLFQVWEIYRRIKEIYKYIHMCMYTCIYMYMYVVDGDDLEETRA